MMLTYNKILSLIEDNNLYNISNLKKFIFREKNKLDLNSLSLIVELSNSNREKHSAYYTNDFIIDDVVKLLPDFNNKEKIHIVEPSVGAGNFLPHLFEKYKSKRVKLTLIDIDQDSIDIVACLYKNKIPSNFAVEFLCADFMLTPLENIDLVVGNPPFTKITKKVIEKYNLSTHAVRNLAGCFLEKAIKISDTVSLIMPKNLLSTPEYSEIREIIASRNVHSILDFGEKGFKGVLIETINILLSNEIQKDPVVITSKTKNKTLYQEKNYIFDKKLPYWVIYRNKTFDCTLKKMKCDVFTVFRDRQITASCLHLEKTNVSIRVIKSRNISNTGKIINKEKYDSFINAEVLSKYSVSRFLDDDSVYLTPNMTYNPRVMKKEKGYIVNGSVAILLPKYDFYLTKEQLLFFSSDEFRIFYGIARNYQTRSLNIDSSSCYWFGIYKE